MKSIETIAAELANGLTLDELREKQSALLTERRYVAPTTPEQQEALRKYWEGVMREPVTNTVLNVTRSTAPEKISYDEARRKVWKLICERAESLGHPFRFTDEQGAVIGKLIRYFINDRTCGLDLTKGLFVYGVPGCGKTEIMRILATFTKESELAKAFVFSDMSEIYAGAIADKNSDPITPNIQFDRCFDEIGLKVGEVNLWGNNIDINESIIYARYNRNRKFGQLTHVVSNHDSKRIEALLTARVFDRMKDLVQSVNYPGESNRGAKSANQ